MTHTPGPWKAEHDYGHHWVSAGKGRKRAEIATVQDVEIGKGSGETDTDEAATLANAQLIAAAPDLLEALEELLSADPDMPSYESTLEKAEAAIRKAREGEQS